LRGMERLATSMLAGEAPLAYVVSALCLAMIYATFVDGTGARIPAWLPVGDPERPRPSIEDLALPDPTGENEGRG